MRIVLLIFLVLHSINGFSQAIVTQIKEVNPFDQSVYIFPKITVRGNTQATQRINLHLQNEMLFREGKSFKRSIFEKVRQSETEPIAALRDIEYAVVTNNAQFISLDISAEGCGAYCEFFTQHFSFDLSTGRPIRMQELFTEQGRKIVSDSLHVWTVRLLDMQIRNAEDSLQKPEVFKDQDAKDHFESVKELYQNCYWRDATINVQEVAFSLRKQNILFFLSRCSNHADRAIDDLDEMLFNVPLANWKRYLTSYGKKMFSDP